MIAKKTRNRFLQIAVFCIGFSQLITPQDSQAGSWPNEPTGFQALTNWPLNTAEGGGWAASPPGWSGSYFTDATAPRSPNKGIHNYRDSSSNHGGSLHYGWAGTKKREWFFAFAIKLSNPHFGWFNWYQKVALLDDPGQHLYMWAVTNESTPAYSSVRFYLNEDNCGRVGYCNRSYEIGNGRLANNIANPFWTNGTWHTVEVYYKGSTDSTSQDGTLRMWVDNTRVLDYTDLNLNPNTSEVCLCNIWDSINTGLSQQEWIEYDDVYVSVPSGTSDPTPPATPRGLQVVN